jgi:hypothetical protein
MQNAVLSHTLWLLALPSLLALAWHLAASWIPVGDRPLWAGPSAARAVGLTSAALTAAATSFHLIALGGAHRAEVALAPGGFHVGEAEVSWGLLFDRISSTGCAWTSILALGVATYLATRPEAERDSRDWAWLSMALAGAQLSCLADGFVTTSLGWVLAMGASAWLSGWANAEGASLVASRGAAALAALFVGCAALFWGVGGSWSGDEYVREAPPRYAVSDRDPPDADPNGAALTFVGSRGSQVYLDGSRVPFAIAPFADWAMPPGAHELRIRRSGDEDTLLSFGAADTVRSFAVVATGPGAAWSYRDLTVALEARAPSGDRWLRRTLAAREGPGGISLVPLVLALFCAAAWATRPAPVGAGAPASLAVFGLAGGGLVPGWMLLARAGVLVPLAPSMSVVVWAVALVILMEGGSSLWAALVGSAPRPAAPIAEWMTGRAAEVGGLLVRFEHWVVDAVANAAVALLRLIAWGAAHADAGPLALPGNLAAERVARCARAIEPWVGGSLARAAWVLLSIAGAFATAHAFWADR